MNTLTNYEEKIEFYYRLAVNIPLEIEKTMFEKFFEISLKTFIEFLVNEVTDFKDALINHLVAIYQDIAEKYVLYSMYNVCFKRYRSEMF